MSKTKISDFDTSLNQTLSKTTRFAPRILLGLLLMSSIALLISAFSFERRLGESSLALSDNNGWNTAQLEVDHQDLMLSLAQGLPPEGVDVESFVVSPAALQNIRTEFDIFYSRVDIFEQRLRHLLSSEDLMAQFTELKAIRDDLANRIDSIEAPDVVALLAFQQAVIDSYPIARKISLDALQESERQAHEARRHEYGVFQVFLVQSIVLVALMALSAFLAMRIWRDL